MMERTPDKTLTEDALLGGRVKFRQLSKGYRAAIDPVLLAAAVEARESESVLDAGAGAGAAALCLAARLDGPRVKGVEIDGFLVDLANHNAAHNDFAERMEVVQGDILQPPESLPPNSFDHVMANPPYRKAGSGNVSPDPVKAASTFEGAAVLRDWVNFCVAMACPKGSVTIIHQADRLAELLGYMQEQLGGIVVFPLSPDRSDKPAKRVIVRGRKGAMTPLRMAKGLVLHENDGAYTPEAEAILRDCRPLVL